MAAVDGFFDPPWNAPLDAEAVIANIPSSATIAGMFFQALEEGAKRRHLALPMPRERYLTFGFYPIAEFAPLLVRAAALFHPDKPLRHGLRRIGAVAPLAFLSSTLGKVTLGASEGVQASVGAIAKTYAINTKPSRCEIIDSKPKSMVLSLDQVCYFIDSHHVGVFEGTLQFAGVQGTVKLRPRGPSSADLLLEW